MLPLWKRTETHKFPLKNTANKARVNHIFRPWEHLPFVPAFWPWLPIFPLDMILIFINTKGLLVRRKEDPSLQKLYLHSEAVHTSSTGLLCTDPERGIFHIVLNDLFSYLKRRVIERGRDRRFSHLLVHSPTSHKSWPGQSQEPRTLWPHMGDRGSNT